MSDSLSSIADVAAIFQVAPSALRYWEEKGLLRFNRHDSNSYRTPSFRTLLDICNVLFYRDLSLPLKDILRIPTLESEAIDALLRDQEAQLLAQIDHLHETIEQLRRQQRLMALAETLRHEPIGLSWEQVPGIYTFSFHDRDLLETFIHNPYQAALVFAPDEPPQYGIFGDCGTTPLLKTADSTKRAYIRGLLQTDALQPSCSNVSAFYQVAQREGLHYGTMYAHYLTTFSDHGQTVDCYEGLLMVNMP